MAKKIYVDLDLQENKLGNIADGIENTDALNKAQIVTLNDESKDYAAELVNSIGGFVSKIDPASGIPTGGSGVGDSINKGDYYYFNTNGNILGHDVWKGDKLLALVADPDTMTNNDTNTDWVILDNHSTDDDRFVISEEALTADVEDIITHNLGQRFVQVIITDTVGNVVDAAIRLIDANTLGITSSASVTVNGVVSL